MKSPDASKDLATIVGGAASRPLRKWLIISIAVLLCAAGGYYYWSHLKAADTGPKYITQAISRGDIFLEITATGNLAPINEVIIGSELSGTVQEVYVEINDVVKKAQPLAKLDTTKLAQQTERSRATLSSAKARVSQTQATVQETEAAFTRLEELHQLSGGKTPSRATLETSRATVARAKADLEGASATVNGAEAELRSIQRDLEKTIIRSPVDGMVLTRTIQVGQTVAASFTAPQLFTIAEDLKKMKLRVAVAEADIGRLAADQTATFKVDAWPTRIYNATVTKVFFGSVVTNNVVTYTTELSVANDDLSLRPGMTATADISLAQTKDVLIVPNSALRFDPVAAAEIGKPATETKTLVQSLSPSGGRRWGRGGGSAAVPTGSPSTNGPRVWSLENGKPREIFVKTGLTDGTITEITEGPVSVGQEIILNVKPAESK